MSARFAVSAFEPLNLNAADVGPIQDRVEEVSFEATEGPDQLSNFYLLLSGNGRGKTTLLNCFVALCSVLAAAHPNLELERAREWLRDYPKARLQLDIRVRYRRGADEGAFLLSLFLGDMNDAALRSYDATALYMQGCSSWHRLGYSLGASGEDSSLLSYCDREESMQLLSELRTLISIAQDMPPRGALERPELTAPTVLFFTAERQVLRPSLLEASRIQRPEDWNYRLVRRFDVDGQRWGDSIDNLLIWLYWLDDGKGRFEQARTLINQRVFRGTPKKLQGIQKDPQQAIILNGRSEHRIDQLSSGEKSLLQLFIRIAAHMTRNTLVIVDELDLHLHPSWERRTVDTLKGLIRDFSEQEEPIHLSVFFTSQSREILERFDVHLPEPPLRKGGAIIRDSFEGDAEIQLPEE